MRLAYILALLSLTGCVSTAPSADCDLLRPAGTACSPARPDLAVEARADSFLALAPAALTDADRTWLAAYATRTPSPAQTTRERNKTVLTVLGVLTIIGVVGAISVVQDATSY